MRNYSMYDDTLEDVVFLLERLNVLNPTQYETGHDLITNADISLSDTKHIREKWVEYESMNKGKN